MSTEKHRRGRNGKGDLGSLQPRQSAAGNQTLLLGRSFNLHFNPGWRSSSLGLGGSYPGLNYETPSG
ncbi:MAG: hypothetical protein RH917_11315 [Lacipirellulaceae bacterium]